MSACRTRLYTAVLPALFAATAAAGVVAQEEFDEFEPIVEINASDGDVGFHVLLDGEGWRWSRVWDPLDNLLFKAMDNNALREQGLTEVFFESAEPPCWDGEGEYDEDEVVTVAQFLERFAAGEYRARGRTLENDLLLATGELTHYLPAAPEAEAIVALDEEEGEWDVSIAWGEGVDLGNCAFDDANLPMHPMDVEIVRWEIVVEPDEDTLEEEGIEWPEDLPFSVFMVQVPGDVHEVEVPDEYLAAYLDAGINYFKFEVGAREESGNQTFTEDTFAVPPGM